VETLLYEGFFKRDPLLSNDSLLFHPPGYYQAGQWGLSTEHLPETLHRNDGVTIIVLVCLLLLVIVVVTFHTPLSKCLKNLFFTQSNQNSKPTTPEIYNTEFVYGLLGLMWCMLSSILYYAYALTHWTLELVPLNSLQILGIYTGVFFLFLLAKQFLLHVVNAIFFDIRKRRAWHQDYSLLFALESILFLPLGLLTVYFGFTPEKGLYVLGFLLLFVKSMVLIKDYAYFFGKIYGVLHLFVYFCALEAAPILVLWTILGRLTNYMTTTL
jgi:hypothetical protein